MLPCLNLVFILDDTADIISCLYNLSVAIRQPAPQDRLKKYGTIEMLHFRESDEKHVREKFPSAEPFLIQRLGSANTQRRKYFKYQLIYYEKIARGLDDVGATNSVGKSPKDIVVTAYVISKY